MADNFIIETNGLGRRYGTRWVVDGLDLKVPKGAVYGFLGLNGAGKSTTIRMLMGLIRRHSGDVKVLGFDPSKDGVEVKRSVGYVAEAPSFYEWMTIDDICSFASTYRKKDWDQKKANELITRFRVPHNTKLKDMSKGQRAKTSLVLAMAYNPELLILDEPTGGLDPVARREFVEGVLAEYQEEGKTIFISSHLVNELSGLVDHVGIIFEGQLLLSQSSEEFMSSVKKIKLTFNGPAPADIVCEGIMRCKTDAREAVVSVRNYNEQVVSQQLQNYNPLTIEVEGLNLEDAFVEFISGAERGAL